MVAVETFQNPWELHCLIEIIARHRPERVLEIGTWDGGTLWEWLQIADIVVSVDDRMRRDGEWYLWADECLTDLYLYQGKSQSDVCIQATSNHAPYDFLFIDGDHTYESVRADWENYSPMVREGGLIALHDILPRPGYGVSVLWEQIKSFPGTRWMEICHNEVLPGNEGRCGIGVVYL